MSNQRWNPCHHQLTRDTFWEPGDPCEDEAPAGYEYCSKHAADHGEQHQEAA